MIPFSTSQTFAIAILEGSIAGVDYIEPLGEPREDSYSGPIAVALDNGEIYSVDHQGIVRDADGDVVDVGAL